MNWAIRLPVPPPPATEEGLERMGQIGGQVSVCIVEVLHHFHHFVLALDHLDCERKQI